MIDYQARQLLIQRMRDRNLQKTMEVAMDGIKQSLNATIKGDPDALGEVNQAANNQAVMTALVVSLLQDIGEVLVKISGDLDEIKKHQLEEDLTDGTK